MEFFIAVFGFLFLFGRSYLKKVDRHAKMEEEMRYRDASDTLSKKYSPTTEFIHEESDLYYHDIDELRIKVRKNYNEILKANRGATEYSIDKEYLHILSYAKEGYLTYNTMTMFELSGDKNKVAEKIEVMHQVENLLIAAGKTDAMFVYYPKKETIVLKEYLDIIDPNAKYKKLW